MVLVLMVARRRLALPLVNAGDPLSANVSFLAHFDGTDAAVSSVDETGRTLTFVGNAQLDTAQSRFGGAALLLDGAGDYVTAPVSNAFSFGSGDFTLEAWVRFAVIAPEQVFIARYHETADQRSFFFRYMNGKLSFALHTAGAGGGYVACEPAWAPAVDTWYHVVAERQGGTVRVMLDGAVLGTVAVSGSIWPLSSDQPLMLGALHTTVWTQFLNGWLDDVRVTKGVARYGGAYTVPAAPFGYDVQPSPVDDYPANTKLLMHLDGADGSTVFTDDATGKVFTNSGGVISTVASKFGASALSLIATTTASNNINTPDHDDWHFGAGAFTVEAWVYFSDAMTGLQTIIGQWGAVGNLGWLLRWNGGGLEFYYSRNGSDYPYFTVTSSPGLNKWHHVAVDRDAAGWMRTYVNGAVAGSAQDTAAFFNSTQPLYIGNSYALDGKLRGYIDEVRVTKGVGRYAGVAFPRPTEPFPPVVFTPAALFSSGEPGAWYDPSDLSTLFQDAAGTVPVVAAGDPVGLIRDKSGRGNHASQSTAAARPTYQTSGGLHWLQFDGVDDSFVTPTITPGIDKAQIFAGVHKLSTAAAIVVELSNSGNANTFYVAAPENSTVHYSSISRGSALVDALQRADVTTVGFAPDTAVITATHDIAGDLSIIRHNAVAGTNGTADKGDGNFGNHPLNIGRRGTGALPFNGRLYGLTVRFGGNLDAARITDQEQWLAAKTGVTL